MPHQPTKLFSVASACGGFSARPLAAAIAAVAFGADRMAWPTGQIKMLCSSAYINDGCNNFQNQKVPYCFSDTKWIKMVRYSCMSQCCK